MNFFQSQERARKQTLLLIGFFILAIISLILLTNILLMFSLGFFDTQNINTAMPLNGFNWQIFIKVSALVIAVILLSSLYKMNSLKKGGRVVAEMLGGKPIIDAGGDINQKKVLNVVEEMAIASGTPVPPVYLLDEEGINAFAAGFSPSDAVIGVTQGCIEQLSRAELQGVIAHEFSHILNGDMRLNIRLMGVLHGILVIGLIGFFLLRSGSYGRYRHRTHSQNNTGGGILALGLGLLVVGYAGTFFGNLIKAAVSRQREYLADASAVQFTRNNMGIANALKRIGASAAGSRMENPAAAQISHALFAEGARHFFSSIFDTHPPLDKRIRQLDPLWDGNYSSTAVEEVITENSQARETQSAHNMTATAALIDQLGQISQQSILQARELLQTIPPGLHKEIYQPHGARAAIYLLLLNRDRNIREAQLAYLQQASDDGVYEVLCKLLESIEQIDISHRLPLIDMSLAALRQLSLPQYQRFKKNIDTLIEIDKKINLFEWSLKKILFNHLDAIFIKATPAKLKYSSFEPLASAVSLLLSMLIYVGKKKKFNQQEIMNQAERELDGIHIQLLPVTEIGIDGLNKSLDQLKQLKPLLKPKLLKACVICITGDNNFSPVEAELFRAIADTLDCPMPLIQADKT